MWTKLNLPYTRQNAFSCIQQLFWPNCSWGETIFLFIFPCTIFHHPIAGPNIPLGKTVNLHYLRCFNTSIDFLANGTSKRRFSKIFLCIFPCVPTLPTKIMIWTKVSLKYLRMLLRKSQAFWKMAEIWKNTDNFSINLYYLIFKGTWHCIWTNLKPVPQGWIVLCLIEISRLVLEKNRWMLNVYDNNANDNNDGGPTDFKYSTQVS